MNNRYLLRNTDLGGLQMNNNPKRSARSPLFCAGSVGNDLRHRSGRIPIKGIAIAVLFTLSSALAQNSATSPLEKLTLGTRGTSTTFMKRMEITSGDSFHDPDLPAAVAAGNMQRYDAIWAANFLPMYNKPAWILLKKSNPSPLTLYYDSSDSARSDDSSGPFSYIDQHHPDWFVVKEMGLDPRNPANRINWSIHNVPGSATSATQATNQFRYYLDVANPEFQRWAAQWFVARATDVAYQGMAADNVDMGAHQAQIIASHYPNWQYAGRSDEWDSGFCKYVATIKDALNKKGLILVANHNLAYGSNADPASWACLPQSVDGLMSEQPLSDHGTPYTADSFEAGLRRHERLLGLGLIDWWVLYPPADETKGHEFFLYHYCSWLLVKVPGRSFFYATRGDPDWTNSVPPWYEEYDLPLGAPLSPRAPYQNCWIRRYAGATIVVNPTQTQQNILINGTAVQLAPATARIVGN
ncbi:MAG: hypothetical protein HY287_10810 [Planctomycetes bacterium]|nr:hypothetical protein [Planctomycetota bacterium]MBI3834809.1 hypothetical protein [Planctomycetota bacterium]